MPIKTDELRTQPVDTLPTPAEVEAASPLSDTVALHIAEARQQAEEILAGRDNRLLVVVGPCSIHDPDAGLDYAKRLKAFADTHRDTLHIIMRTYFEKPRTVVGWKGMINDPRLDGSCNLREGLFKARKFLLDVNTLGMPTATEFLDMITGQYIADLVSWGAIGARTTESQIHREMASALSCPVGFKNGTDGNIKIAIDAIRSSQTSHLFCSPDKQGVMTIYRTSGNPYGHVILRGGHQPNYHRQDVVSAADDLNTFDLVPRLVVDFSHANCEKQHKRQIDVAADICQQIVDGDTHIAGIMAESFIEEGNQAVDKDKIDSLTYGQSITDPCLSWDDTTTMLQMLSDAVAKRNS
ncbi:3-deoxy-7-phosphoheptulonate synthase [Enterovibrio norvegicus FF-33]|uniref:Phospho-2-dehydro-3-deoxyheptonate aldolase n=1 Tax=Enterovibrio norvegicus FF-454 TaxID=1185651 RepID=A0A1E5C9L8_9GAMM|nr:3-deoxy-7-phosphoheptulonate synthase [Enterovibrio norvegicus]OEE62224.1 3-deoxy-7-phosphoheptulonate synthase [Enterovibrio norvegicus FF-454]OEE65809.1 3-deoxy-7-phosphoheptulonate synthase [Enterovibrio norvegicus FF-33]OEE89159.1 3-deoxy-7-phosphoheptulonate synthase [Enterovibrio norvegicus FF-162]